MTRPAAPCPLVAGYLPDVPFVRAAGADAKVPDRTPVIDRSPGGRRARLRDAAEGRRPK